MSNYGNPPEDPDQPAANPYGAPPTYGQQPGYGQQPAYGEQPNYGQPLAYGQGAPAATWAYAGWPKRVGAYLIDTLLGLVAFIPYFIAAGMLAGSVDTTTDPVTGMPSATGGAEMSGTVLVLMLVSLLLYVAYFVWNICIKQGRTGYSIGKGVLGIKLVKEETGEPIGAGMSFVRQLAHILDSLPCNIGYLWPLWDAKRQTFADKVMGTVVVEQPKP